MSLTNINSGSVEDVSELHLIEMKLYFSCDQAKCVFISKDEERSPIKNVIVKLVAAESGDGIMCLMLMDAPSGDETSEIGVFLQKLTPGDSYIWNGEQFTFTDTQSKDYGSIVIIFDDAQMGKLFYEALSEPKVMSDHRDNEESDDDEACSKTTSETMGESIVYNTQAIAMTSIEVSKRLCGFLGEMGKGILKGKPAAPADAPPPSEFVQKKVDSVHSFSVQAKERRCAYINNFFASKSSIKIMIESTMASHNGRTGIISGCVQGANNLLGAAGESGDIFKKGIEEGTVEVVRHTKGEDWAETTEKIFATKDNFFSFSCDHETMKASGLNQRSQSVDKKVPVKKAAGRSDK